MGLFDSFLDTASSAFNWLDNNKAALDMISGAAKGFGAYMQYKQGQDQMKQYKQMYDDEQRRWQDTHSAPSQYDNSIPMSSYQASSLLSGNMADALKAGGQ